MQEYAAPIDLDDEWKALSGKLKKEKKRSIFFILIPLFFAIVSAGYFVNYSLSNHEINTTLNQESKTNNSSSISSEGEELIGTPNIATTSQAMIEDTSLSDQTSNGQDVIFFELNSIKNKTRNTPTVSIGVDKQYNQENLNNIPYTNRQKIILGSANKLENTSATLSKNTIKASTLFTPKIINESSLASTPYFSIQSLPSVSMEEFVFDKKSPKWMSTTLSSQPIINPLHKKAFELYGGIGILSSQQIFSARDGESNDLNLLRQSTEQALETYYAELGITYNITDRLFVYGGVSYTQAYDKFTFTQTEDQSYLVENALKEVVIFRRQDALEIYGNEEVIGRKTTSYTNYNKYNSYSGSIGIGKQIMRRQKINLAASLGLGWNIRTNSSGLITDINQGSTEVIDAAMVYNNSFGWSVEGGIHLSYPLSNQLSLELKPMLRYYTQSVTDVEYGVATNLYRVGGIIGLSHRFKAGHD